MPDLDPAPTSKPSPFGWLFASRKGLLTVFVLFVAVLFALAVAIMMVRGKIDANAGFALIGAGLLGWFGVAFKTIDAISKEDVAEKSNSGS